jgi:hypothetical protein
LQRSLVEADHWPLRVVRLGVHLEHILHVGYETWADLRDAPVFLEPGCEPVLSSSRRTVSSEMAGTTWRTASSLPSSCIVQHGGPPARCPAAASSSTWSSTCGPPARSRRPGRSASAAVVKQGASAGPRLGCLARRRPGYLRRVMDLYQDDFLVSIASRGVNDPFGSL